MSQTQSKGISEVPFHKTKIAYIRAVRRTLIIALLYYISKQNNLHIFLLLKDNYFIL